MVGAEVCVEIVEELSSAFIIDGRTVVLNVVGHRSVHIVA